MILRQSRKIITPTVNHNPVQAKDRRTAWIVASPPAGSRIPGYLSLGVIAKVFLRENVEAVAVLERIGRA